jgi:hypothetical protein
MINKELLLKLYMDRVNQIAEDLEDKTTFNPKEIIDIIGNIIEKNFDKVINEKTKYVAFEESEEYDGLVQVSIPLDTFEEIKDFQTFNSKKLYIFKSVN